MTKVLRRYRVVLYSVFFVGLVLSVVPSHADTERPIPPEFTDTSIFLTPILNATGTPLDEKVSGITVPHHLLASDLIAQAFLLASRGSYDRIIILSPDHYNLGSTDISISRRNLSTVLGELETDTHFVDQLTQLPFVSTADFFYREHGIEAELPFVAHYFPGVPVVAIALKESTTQSELSAFVDLLEQNIDKRTLIVQSTDFSHYLPKAVANTKDRQTLAVLKSDDPEKLFSLNQSDNLDSIASQYVQMRVQKDIFGAAPNIIADKNSQDYTKEKLTSATSYITQFYVPTSSTATVAAVGDIMLGRYVATLMNRYGESYPFKKIAGSLNAFDAVIGNLEGPITSNQPQNSSTSIQFSFAPKVAQLLAQNNFKVLSLANNHSYDLGESGYLSTQKYLGDYSIDSVGNPYSVDKKYTSIKFINGKKFAFIAINGTDPYFPEQDAVSLITNIKQEQPDAFLIVLAHWGDEYSLTENQQQQSLAHDLIDAGANMIIGAHPHVVEGIEKYKGKLIFYSLGNFIFDQYFSDDTQNELMVELQFSDSGVTCQLIPVRSARSQPNIMPTAQAIEWLYNLSERSGSQLQGDIQKGVITGL